MDNDFSKLINYQSSPTLTEKCDFQPIIDKIWNHEKEYEKILINLPDSMLKELCRQTRCSKTEGFLRTILEKKHQMSVKNYSEPLMLGSPMNTYSQDTFHDYHYSNSNLFPSFNFLEDEENISFLDLNDPTMKDDFELKEYNQSPEWVKSTLISLERYFQIQEALSSQKLSENTPSRNIEDTDYFLSESNTTTKSNESPSKTIAPALPINNVASYESFGVLNPFQSNRQISYSTILKELLETKVSKSYKYGHGLY